MPRKHFPEVRRQQILAAAVRVICDRGLCETSIADIAAAAGVSAALVVYYFGAKDRLMAAAMAYSEERFYARIAAVDRTARPSVQLVRLIQLCCPSDAEADGEVWDDWAMWMELWPRSRHDPLLGPAREALDRRWWLTISAVVRAGQEAGEFAAVDPDDFAVRLAALIDGLCIQAALHDPELPPARVQSLLVASAGRDLGMPLPEPAEPALDH